MSYPISIRFYQLHMLPQWPLSEINGPAIISTTSTHQRLYIRSAKQPQLHFSSDYGKWANQLKALEATPIPFAEGLAKFVHLKRLLRVLTSGADSLIAFLPSGSTLL